MDKLLAEAGSLMGIAKGDEREKIMKKRLEPWVNEILPAKTARIEFGLSPEDGSGEGTIFQIGPTGSAGISQNIIKTQSNKYRDGDLVDSKVLDCSESISAHTTFATSTGW